MKKLIGLPLSYLFYYLGDFVYSYELLPYSGYSFLMETSLEIQEWANLNRPWR